MQFLCPAFYEIREVLNSGDPSDKTDSKEEKSPYEADELFEESLRRRVTDNDKSVKALKIIRDVENAPEQQKAEPPNYETPTLSGQMESATPRIPKEDDNPQQNYGPNGFEGDISHGFIIPVSNSCRFREFYCGSMCDKDIPINSAVNSDIENTLPVIWCKKNNLPKLKKGVFLGRVRLHRCCSN